jgi:CarboxypepD_reg-like domain/Secretion system C-terminal sorting domain
MYCRWPTLEKRKNHHPLKRIAMPTKLSLTIADPCHEKWSNMTPVEQGRFCGSCQKQVVDFTAMSDSQLAAFFKKPTTGSVCGRFMADQLNKEITVPAKRMPWIKYFFQLAIPAFLFSMKAKAQGTVRVITGDTVVVPSTPRIKMGIIAKAEPLCNKPVLLNGMVKDADGNPMPYVSVIVKGTNMGAATDTTGRFSFSYTTSEALVTLVSSSVGFESVETIIDTSETEGIEIKLANMKSLGEVVVSSNSISCSLQRRLGGVLITRTKVSLMETIKEKFLSTSKGMNVYPNPVKSNSSITIDMGKPEEGTYRFNLFAMNGQTVFTKTNWIDKGARVIEMPVPGVSPGMYLLQVMHTQSKKGETVKVMIN